MRDWLVENRITSAFLPTVLAEAILDQEWPAGTALRYLHTGGDVLHRFTPAGLPFDLVNNYGPTENTVVTSSGVVPRELRGDRLPTIGRPIPGVYVRVLDEELQRPRRAGPERPSRRPDRMARSAKLRWFGE